MGAVGGAAVLGGGTYAYGANYGQRPERAAVTFTKIADLTGNENSTKFGVSGTNRGIPVRTPQNQKLFVFGDSYEGAHPSVLTRLADTPTVRSPER